MSIPNDDHSPLSPLTDQEREFLEAYRDLDESDRVFVWSAILTELGRRPIPDEDSIDVKELHPEIRSCAREGRDGLLSGAMICLLC